MQTTNALMAAICAVMILLGCAAAIIRRKRTLVGLANIAEGTHAGALTKKADGAIATRFLLVKVGSDGDHVTAAGATDTPWGVCVDEAEAAEDLVAVMPLASAKGTVKCVTDGTGALAVGDLLVPAAGGKVKKISAGAGNYYVVGMAMQTAPATDGEVLEVIPIGAWKTQ